MDLLLIRHAQSLNNAVSATLGTSRGRVPDPPLTPLGQSQAEALAQAFTSRLYPMRPTALYASLMSRAIQTAAPLAAALQLPLHALVDAFEVGGPLDWDGDEWSEQRHHPGSPASVLRQHSAHLVLPETVTEQGWWGGPIEMEPEAAYRAARVVAALRDQYGGSDHVIALVSHEWFGQLLIRELLGSAAPPPQTWITLNNTGVSYFLDADVDGPVTTYWLNAVGHLRLDQITA